MRGLNPDLGAPAVPPAVHPPAGARAARSREGARRGNPVRKYWLSVVLVAACLTAGTYVVNQFSAQNEQMARVEAERSMLGKRLEAAGQRHEQLKSEIARLKTDEYIETVAREQLGYIRPGETPYMALDKAGQTP